MWRSLKWYAFMELFGSRMANESDNVHLLPIMGAPQTIYEVWKQGEGIISRHWSLAGAMKWVEYNAPGTNVIPFTFREMASTLMLMVRP